MTTLDFTHHQTRHSGRLSATLGRLGAAWRRQRLYRQTVRELSDLSDRHLADLGLDRSAIAEVARNGAEASIR